LKRKTRKNDQAQPDDDPPYQEQPRQGLQGLERSRADGPLDGPPRHDDGRSQARPAGRRPLRHPHGGWREEHFVSGTYREIVPGEKLVFTWAWRSTPERESLVTVLVRPAEGGTELTLKHEQFFDDTARDMHRQGWEGALDKLVELFATEE
jgi:uncharacterized protein YndB with AHSA1/START domain